MDAREKLEKFGNGPWMNEPDHVAFEHEGVPCLIRRNPMGAWCGYAAVPPGHPWHGAHYDTPSVDVHGGLTYAKECQGEICHVPKPGESADVWWFGFDCSHADDLTPGLAKHYYQSVLTTPDWEYRDQAYAMAETRRLAEQVNEAREP